MSCEKIDLLSSRSRSQWGFIIKYDCFSHICWTSLLFLQPSLNGWYIIIFWSVLCKYWIAVFIVKVTVKVQIFIGFLSVIFSVPLVTNFGVLVFCITNKQNQVQWSGHLTDRNTVNYSITRLIRGGVGYFIVPCKAANLVCFCFFLYHAFFSPVNMLLTLIVPLKFWFTSWRYTASYPNFFNYFQSSIRRIVWFLKLLSTRVIVVSYTHLRAHET